MTPYQLLSCNFRSPHCRTSWLYRSGRCKHSGSIMRTLLGRWGVILAATVMGCAGDARLVGWSCTTTGVTNAMLVRYAAKRNYRPNDSRAHPSPWAIGCRAVPQWQRVPTSTAILIEWEHPLRPFPLHLPLKTIAVAVDDYSPAIAASNGCCFGKKRYHSF